MILNFTDTLLIAFHQMAAFLGVIVCFYYGLHSRLDTPGMVKPALYVLGLIFYTFLYDPHLYTLTSTTPPIVAVNYVGIMCRITVFIYVCANFWAAAERSGVALEWTKELIRWIRWVDVIKARITTPFSKKDSYSERIEN